jgi:6-phosphogluconolactonase
VFAYVGSITSNPGGTPSTGISVLTVDPESGALNRVQEVSDVQSPTYVAIHPRLSVLYAGERDWPPMGAQSPGTGSVTAFAIDTDGQLKLLARQPGGGAAHLNVHPGGRYVFAAMTRLRKVTVFPVAPDGRVGEPCAVVEHTGSGPRSPNQDAAFPHSCWFDASATRVLCCDLGIDRVMLYDFNPHTGQLQPSARPFAQVSSGAGPRHLALHANGQVVYVLNELDSTISVFRYDAESSKLSILQTVSTLPSDFRGQNAAAQILIHPSGRFVYASNRGHESIAIFAIDQSQGTLRFIGHEPSGGERPHNFSIEPSGRLMLVTNQRSGSVVGFHIEATSGALHRTRHDVDVPSPVCVVFHS